MSQQSKPELTRRMLEQGFSPELTDHFKRVKDELIRQGRDALTEARDHGGKRSPHKEKSHEST